MRGTTIFRFIPKVFLVTLGIGFLAVTAFSLGRFSVTRKGENSRTNNQVQTALVNQKKEINKELSFDLKAKDSKAQPEKIKFELVSAEILEEILVKGEKVKAAGGRGFLIFTLKITNEGKHTLQVNSRDFIRLSSSLKEEWLAPEIHSDPVEVQALATKYTRVGFSTNLNEKTFKVRIGEIDGEKTDFELRF